MSIETYIEGLRAKPEHIRRHYALWSSLGMTAIIFAFWISSFSSFGSTSESAVARVVDKAGTPAQSLVASAADFLTDIRDLVFAPKKVTYPSVEVKAGKR